MSVKIIAAILKTCFEMAVGICEEGEKEFREKIFNSSMMNAALKL